MKKAIKIICILISFCFIVIAITHLPVYRHNKVLIDIYNDNSELFNIYMDSIDMTGNSIDNESEEDYYLLNLPDSFENICVFRIVKVDSFVFFDCELPYYCGIYYSVDDKYAEEIPFYDSVDGEFHTERKTIYVKGKKNNGENWYMTEKITDNWYYYEVHS